MTAATAQHWTTCHRCKAAIRPGQHVIREGHRMFSHPVCVPNEADCNQMEALLLETATMDQIEKEKRQSEKRREMAEALLTRGERRLIGGSLAVSQGVLFAQDEDLFTGAAQERKTA